MNSANSQPPITVNDPGTDTVLLYMEQVPNVNPYPPLEESTTSGSITSVYSPQAPVTVLRYNDDGQNFLEGGQPLSSSDMYVVVKTDCNIENEDWTPLVEFTNGDDGYNVGISVTFPNATTTTTTNPNDDSTTAAFLDATTFSAAWNYTSFWCAGMQDDNNGSSPPPTETNDETKEEITTSNNPSDPTASPTTMTTTEENTSGGLSSNKALVPLMVTIVSGIAAMAFFERGHSRSSRSTTMLVMMMTTALLMAVMGFVVVGATATTTSNNNNNMASSTAESTSRRNLQGDNNGSTCRVTVEILLDGCRRASSNNNNIDLQVEAPAVRIMDGKVTDFQSMENPSDKCTTDYTATLTWEPEGNSVAEARQGGEDDENSIPTNTTWLVPSFSQESPQYGYCFRPVEGRPYIDAHGRHIQATAIRADHDPTTTSTTMTKVAWSKNDNHDALLPLLDRDEELGRKWAERAVGEHASVPAFAAFTIALMSNNAPPQLVQDALSAAQDEVNHAKTSFDIASRLLGETVEPSALPPSSLDFGQDLLALALAAAKEGCIDETLSALVAGFEVDYQIDQTTRISDDTKKVLKEKIHKIAMEETNHSALAWRTVRWACQIDPNICRTVQQQVFDTSYLKQAFARRFDLDSSHASEAQLVWERVYSTLVPLVTAEGHGMELPDLVNLMDCGNDSSMVRELEKSANGSNVLVQMSDRIIRQVGCSL